MAGAGGSTKALVGMLGGGAAGIAIGTGLEHAAAGPHWLVALFLGVGGLSVVFGACELMIKFVDGVAARVGWDPYVAGTMGGIASNIPELVMLGFIVAAEPRIAFILVALTLHVGALAFGVYSALVPRDETGLARMPDPLVELSTDLYACAASILLSIGLLMLMLQEFGSGATAVDGLAAGDLYVIGGTLLAVEIVAVKRLVARFSSVAGSAGEGGGGASMKAIVGYGVVGIGASVLGGHAVGTFAEILVAGLEEAGYSQMIGALILAFFACAGVFVMIVTTHLKGKYDLAIANVSGAVTQVPFVVLPIVLILYAAFAQTGVVPLTEGGAVLPIDLETTSVVLLGVPPMLILWKSIQDDGQVNWLETASMLAVFVCTLYFLGVHG